MHVILSLIGRDDEAGFSWQKPGLPMAGVSPAS